MKDCIKIEVWLNNGFYPMELSVENQNYSGSFNWKGSIRSLDGKDKIEVVIFQKSIIQIPYNFELDGRVVTSKKNIADQIKRILDKFN